MDRLYIGILIGIVFYFLYSKMFGGKTSGFTMQPFSSMTDRSAVTTSFQTQTAQLTNELKTKLTEAIQGNKSTEELINLSNSYADQSNDLNKAYSAWQLQHRNDVVAPAPGPAPAPRA
jgi:hypothetical protein